MNSVELDAYIEECLQTNPMLDTDPDVVSQTDAGDASQAFSEEMGMDNEWPEAGDNRWERMYAPPSWEGHYGESAQLCSEEALGQRLHEQVNCQPMSPNDRRIAHAIIDSLDEEGYFRVDEHELADQIHVNAGDIVSVLENVIHQLEPAGIGARSLEECLLLQLDGSDNSDGLARLLLTHYSDHLGQSDDELSRMTGSSIELLEAARARLRRLDPFPGHHLSGDSGIYIRPDVIFHGCENGGFRIEIPPYSGQGIRFSSQWQGHQWRGKENDFMSRAMREAKWLINALEQRSLTLKKVAEYLAVTQERFLRYGFLGLKPLTMQEVAVELGLHESTVSRVTSGKFAQTPIGLIEMKQFFSPGLPTRGGGTISVFRVQQRIKALIGSEPRDCPLSDQAISDQLRVEGVQITRRTVAKYREQLQLPPARRRKVAGSAGHEKPRFQVSS
jgi:RNA polymerase sigma-54 factor